jgi:hypothetical protein
MLQALIAVVLGLHRAATGTAWTIHALQLRLRRQADEQHRINAEWAVLRTAPQHHNQCPRWSIPWTEHYWYIAATIIDNPPGDD